MLVVDASHVLARGFQVASPDRKSPSGAPTNALFALASALGRALAFKQPDLAVAIVETAPSRVPALLAPQVAQLPELLEAHGLRVVPSERPRDLVASYAEAGRAGGDVVVLGSDKRFAQLVEEQRVWWYDPYKDVRYTPELVRKRFEVPPDRVAGWLALVGDDDALPGVPGLGKKGATDLVAAFGSIDAAITDADKAEGRPGKMLRASLAIARSEVERARLRRDEPLPIDLSKLAYVPPTPAALNATYGALGFSELLSSGAVGRSVSVVVCETAASIHEAIASLEGAPAALHVLTEDPSPVRGELAGLAISRGDGRALYVPFVGQGACFDPSILTGYLSDPSRPKVGHEINAAVVAFARRGVEIRGIVGDTACASHLLEPSSWAPHDLQLVAKHRIQRPLEDESSARGVGGSRKPWARLSVDRAASHAGAMADATAALWRSFAPDVPRALLAEYLALSETVARMELAGIACSGEDLLRSGDDFTAIAAEVEAQIHALAGRSFNLGSTKQLGAVLYEELDLPITKRTKTGWSTATEALERIELAHPIVALVIRWREVQRLRDSWVTTLRASIDPDGRIRSTFHPARSFSGRLVNTQPDLGRVPGRTPEMVRIRRAFRATPGTTLLSVDYNQLGLFVLAHLSRDPALVEPLRRGDDLHRVTAAAVLDLPLEAVGPAERQRGKVVNFATFAGQGASALGFQLGLAPAESKRLIERFDAHYALVRAFQEGQLELARERGFIETIAGRRWPIDGLRALDPQIRSNAERMARRSTHEGSVADVSRRGLLRADRALRAAGLRARPLLQVHDEVLFEVPDDELEPCAALASEAMRTAYDLEVPLRVGKKAGPSWGELTPMR